MSNHSKLNRLIIVVQENYVNRRYTSELALLWLERLAFPVEV